MYPANIIPDATLTDPKLIEQSRDLLRTEIGNRANTARFRWQEASSYVFKAGCDFYEVDFVRGVKRV